VPNRETAWTCLWGLNRARLTAAFVVLATGGLLQYLGTFPFPFAPFAIAAAGIGVACLLLPLGWARVQKPRRFAWLQISLDAVLVTAVVATTGGPQSIFIPLYVLAVIGACVVLPRSGALVVAGLSSLLQIGLAAGRAAAVLLGFAEPVDMTPLEVLAVVLNTAVLLVTSVVIASLTDRYRRSQARLEAQRQDLHDVEAFRDLIFESVGSGLVAVDPSGRVTAFNRAAESITGVQARNALGQPWGTIFGNGIDLEQVQRVAIDEPTLSARHEFLLRRRDGSELPVGISFWSLRSGGGDVVGLIGVCQDLSLIKQMEERMRQADRLATVGRLSANMAHEIRNPLASISGAVEALAKDLPPDEPRNRLVEIVLRESGRLNGLVGDFLEYARPAPMASFEVDMAQLLDEVLLLIEHRSLPPDLKIIREYGLTLTAHVDPQHMRQAIWNLCLNAVQAIPDAGGEIRVGGCRAPGDAGRLQIWIADTGHGIDAVDLPHIFEPFYSTKPEGSGLGLALVYRVIQDHRGQIEVKSRPGDGTTFTLTLPTAPEALRPASGPSITRRP
jgi:two-component system sensor histidine kinase PilS (NtrC family)